VSSTDPRFYYYPESTGGLAYVDLGGPLTNITVIPGIVRKDGVGYDGSYSTAVYGPDFTVRVLVEHFGADSPGANATERGLQGLINHLRRGGACGFTRRHDKAWCGKFSGGTAPGWGYAPTFGNEFSSWSGSAALASGDEVAIESGPARNRHEIGLVSSVTAGRTVNLSATTLYEHGDGTAASWCRYRWFFPVCYLPADDAGANADPLTHDGLRNWTLDLRLRFSPGLLATALAGDTYKAPGIAGATPAITLGSALRSTSTTGTLAGRTLDQMLAGNFTGPRRV